MKGLTLKHLIECIAGPRPSRREAEAGALPAVLVLAAPDTAAQAASPDWRVLAAAGFAEAEALIAAHDVAVALCDRDAPAFDWKQAVPALARARCRPSVVLLANTGDLRLWEQVTAAGGYDVLRKPLDPEALSRVIRAGIAHWRSARALEQARTRTPVR